MANELQTVKDQGGQLTVDAVVGRLHAVQELMRKAMVPGIDYGKIPGAPKPMLLKAGAEKLCLMFQFPVSCETVKTFHEDGHLTVESTCTVGTKEAAAMCSTRESKYAYRKGERKCPECGAATVFKSKKDPGFYCWEKKGGCGAQFGPDDERITTQEIGRVDNPDLADLYNTVLRIAEKRAFVAATKLATGSSSLFDEESPQFEEPPKQQQQKKAEPPDPVVEGWRTELQECRSAFELNESIKAHGSFGGATGLKVWALFLERGKAIECTWDKNAKCFLPPQTPKMDIPREPGIEPEEAA